MSLSPCIIKLKYLQVFKSKWFSLNNRLNQVYPHRSNILKSFNKNVSRNISNDKGSVCILRSIGATAFVGYYLRKNLTAFCEYRSKKIPSSRLLEEKEKNEINFPWLQFFKLIVPDLLFLIGAIITALAVAIINIQLPLMLGDVVNVLSNCSKESKDNFIDLIKTPALKMIWAYILQGGLTFGYISLLSTLGERLSERMRIKLFNQLINQDVSFFDEHNTGEIVNRLTSDIQDFKSSFKICISQGLRALTQTIGCFVSLYILSPKLSLLMIVIVPTIVGGGTLVGTILRTLSKKAQAQAARATSVADEAIGNARTVKAFAMENKEIELFSQEVEQSSNYNKLLGYGIAAFQALSNIALNGIVLGSLYAGGYLMSQNEISPGNLMSFLVASQTIQRSLAQLSLLFGQVVRGLSAGSRVFEYMLLDPSMQNDGGLKIFRNDVKGSIVFRNVEFSYPTRKNQVILKNFNLEIPDGKITALCGLSGGGKSTIAALLERFYDCSQGEILIDGENIKDYDTRWLRGEAIGYINQEPVLFATSILENIRYGYPDATDDEVCEAAKMANAHDFISRFPDGYNTVVGERGATVSGGQKQRIAIARALIKKPSILILDEATSALDAESERIVQDTLDDVCKGRTVLVIAHRLSTIQNADSIAVVSAGSIVEKGTHEELKARKGVYWKLVRKQEKDDILRSCSG